MQLKTYLHYSMCHVCYFPMVAMPKYPKLSSLSNKIYFIIVLEAKCLKSK